MNESREYVSRQEAMGNIHIADEVLTAIVAAATIEVEGVGGLASNHGSDIAELLTRKNLKRGIQLQVEEDTVTIDVSILIKYGTTIPDVARAVQEAVASSVEATSGLRVLSVNVNVGGVVFEKEPRA